MGVPCLKAVLPLRSEAFPKLTAVPESAAPYPPSRLFETGYTQPLRPRFTALIPPALGPTVQPINPSFSDDFYGRVCVAYGRSFYSIAEDSGEAICLLYGQA